MSPLLSPEERLKRLKSISLDDVLGRGRRPSQPTTENRRRSAGYRSAAAEERERQRREASRRSRTPNAG